MPRNVNDKIRQHFDLDEEENDNEIHGLFRICLHLIIIFVSHFKPLFYKNIIQIFSDVRSSQMFDVQLKLWKNSSCLRHPHRISSIAHSFNGSNEINSKRTFKAKTSAQSKK